MMLVTGRGRGLGLTDAEITAALVAGAGPGTPAYEARYGAGGTYQREGSVIATYGDANNDSIADVGAAGSWDQGSPRPPSTTAPSESSAPPLQYAMEACSPFDSACVARNEARQQANFVLADNARRAYNLEVCRYNDSLNPGVADCSMYLPRPVPPAPGTPGAPVATGSGYSPTITETAAQAGARVADWTAAQRDMTAQQAASASANRPNQTVPPRPQPGDVPAYVVTGQVTAGGTAAGAAPDTSGRAASGADDKAGTILGLDPKMWMLIAAGAGALLLLKK